MDLRTEVEVRDVQQAVKQALHRDLIDVQYRPAATPEDLLDGLNDVRPHVVHFSGHAGGAAVLFDNASVDSPEGREVPFELLARALGATAESPTLLVLNGCDTLDGAEVLLEATPVVIAMSTEISDLAATAFAARFYAAVASAQPIGPALRQGAVLLDLMGLDEGWKPSLLARDDVAVDDWSWCKFRPSRGGPWVAPSAWKPGDCAGRGSRCGRPAQRSATDVLGTGSATACVPHEGSPAVGDPRRLKAAGVDGAPASVKGHRDHRDQGRSMLRRGRSGLGLPRSATAFGARLCRKPLALVSETSSTVTVRSHETGREEPGMPNQL